MKRKLIAVASAAMIGLTAAAIPNKAEAHWHGGWWVPGAVIGGLALGAAIASRPYYYDYGYGPDYYDYGPGYAPYYGGYYYNHRPYYRYRYYYRHPYYRHRYYRHY